MTEPLKCANCGQTNFRVHEQVVTAAGLDIYMMCQTPFRYDRVKQLLPEGYESRECCYYLKVTIPWEHIQYERVAEEAPH